MFVGVTGALILLRPLTTSISGFGRLAYSLGEHGQLPRALRPAAPADARRRREAIVAAALISIAICSSARSFVRMPCTFLASLFTFGVLLAFTAAQLAVIKLRFTEPDLPRPYRVPFNVIRRARSRPVGRRRGADVRGLGRRDGDARGRALRRPGLARVGLVVYVVVRASRGEGLIERVVSRRRASAARGAALPKHPRADEAREIGEEMVATAVKLAQERGAAVEALHVISVPMELALDAELVDEEERAEASLAEAELLGADNGVEVEGRTVRARAIGQAIVQAARGSGRRPDRARLVAALAPAVAVLLAHRRLRPPEGARARC